jgi:hypothetical protein
MPTQNTDVRIRRDYALKPMQRHRMTYEKFGLIQQAIDNGWCFKAKSITLNSSTLTMPAVTGTTHWFLNQPAQARRLGWSLSSGRAKSSSGASCAGTF